MKTPPNTPPQLNTLEHLNLLPYQSAFAANNARFKIGLWARQTGKDHTATAEAVLDCVSHGGVTWLILAASERQAIESLTKARDWSEIIRCVSKSRVRITSASNKAIKWSNSSRLLALPARPSTIRGFSANLILTEFAFHEDPESLWRAVFPMITNPLKGGEKKLRVITTPNGQGNFFHQLWKSANPDFHKQTVTIHDAIADGLPLQLGTLRRGIANPDAWAQEYECQFMDTATVLLPYELIESCESTEATQTSTPELLSQSSGDLFIGIDFGRKHHLTVAWTLERLPIHQLSISNQQSSPLLLTREVLVLDRMSTPDQFAILRQRVARARKVCLDATGAGIGLGDLLVRDFQSRVELCQFTAGLKQELFPRLRTAFERGLLRIPPNRDIREDLHALQRVVSLHGQITYRADSTEDGHSDRCTALALALRAAETSPPPSRPSIIGRGLIPLVL